ncbi:MAG: glycosyltransferase family 4 protein, partial [Candidatus Brocadiales bacterium]
MRITFVNRLTGILWGGGETFDLEVARALRCLGHSVEFVIGRRWTALDIPMMEFPTTYIRTPYLRGIWYRTSDSQRGALQVIGGYAMLLDVELFERMAFRQIVEKRIAERTDVFQLCGLPRLGAWIRQRLHAHSVIVWHGPARPGFREWNTLCSGTLAVGDSLASVREYADPRAVEILPGVNTDLFRRPPADEVRSRYGVTEDDVLFIFVGRLIPIKGIPFLLKAFSLAIKENPHLRLMLVGDGPSKPELERDVFRLGLRGYVLFTGRQTGKALVSHYGAADAFVITSTYESFSLVTLEAMACELPVIATRVGGLQLIVE